MTYNSGNKSKRREFTWYPRKCLFRTEESSDGGIEEQKRHKTYKNSKIARNKYDESFHWV